MITDYKIEKVDHEEVLFLYINSVEFSLSWFHDFKDYSIKKFIKTHNINFNGKKIILVLGTGLLIPLLITNNSYKSKVELDNQLYVSNILNTISDKFKDNNESLDNSNSVITDNKENISIIDTNNNSTNKNNSNNSTTNINNNIKNDNIKDTISSNNNSNNTINNSTNSGSNATSNPNSSNNTVSSNTNKVDTPTTNNPSEIQVTVKRSNGSVITIGMTDYLIGVVASEMPASFNSEALKAQAVVARTYAIKRIQNNLVITDTVSTQVYKDNNQLKSMWENNFDTYYKKIKNAVTSTEKEVCLYNNTLIDAVYHSTSNGMTEDAEYVWGNATPYLVSVESPYDKNVNSYLKEVEFDNTKLLQLFGIDIDNLKIEILSRNKSGRVDKVLVNDKTFTGVEFRNLLGLRSSDFDIKYLNNGLLITTRGFGHGVGMSQYGANGMANAGYSYKQILNHYYNNITIEKR